MGRTILPLLHVLPAAALRLRPLPHRGGRHLRRLCAPHRTASSSHSDQLLTGKSTYFLLFDSTFPFAFVQAIAFLARMNTRIFCPPGSETGISFPSGCGHWNPTTSQFYINLVHTLLINFVFSYLLSVWWASWSAAKSTETTTTTTRDRRSGTTRAIWR